MRILFILHNSQFDHSCKPNQDLRSLVVYPGQEVRSPPHLEDLQVSGGESQMVSNILRMACRTIKKVHLRGLEGNLSEFKLDCKMESELVTHPN